MIKFLLKLLFNTCLLFGTIAIFGIVRENTPEWFYLSLVALSSGIVILFLSFPDKKKRYLVIVQDLSDMSYSFTTIKNDDEFLSAKTISGNGSGKSHEITMIEIGDDAYNEYKKQLNKLQS